MTNSVWKQQLRRCLADYDHIVAPRSLEVREVKNGSYRVPMPAYLNLKSRNINVAFMFAEAAWILSGSNLLEDLTLYLKGYAKFSDDQVFMRGAYGPKVVDQLPYIVDTIAGDVDTRQAVLTIWRERPGPSLDIPCTVAIQFLVRNGQLNMITTMRSQDIVLGFTYDVFTFSMIATYVKLLLEERGIKLKLGNLYVNVASLHLYSDYYQRAEIWVETKVEDPQIREFVDAVLEGVSTHKQLIKSLRKGAKQWKNEYASNAV